jgi:hypothetical protein
MAISQDVIDSARAKYGDVMHLSAEGFEVLVRRPSREQYRRFRAAVNDPKLKPDAVENLLRDCTAHPDAKGLDAILDARPGLAEVFGSAVLDLAGVGAEADAKKL